MECKSNKNIVLVRGDDVVRVVKCPYCLYSYEVDDSWMKDEFGLIHECTNCEDEYLITKTEVKGL